MYVTGKRCASTNNGEQTRKTTEQKHKIKTNILTANSPILLSSIFRKCNTRTQRRLHVLSHTVQPIIIIVLPVKIKLSRYRYETGI